MAIEKGVLQRQQWLSPNIQNELIDLIAERVFARISERIKRAKFFGIIADETSDISKREQVSICFRFLLDGVIDERFFGFYDTISTTGEAITNLICDVVKDHGFDFNNLVGLGFDGASAMKSEVKGVAGLMKEKAPNAIFVHCNAHRLNLALQKTLKSIPALRNSLGIMETMYNVMEGSPKRHGEFRALQEEDDLFPTTLKKMCDTRWSSRYLAVSDVKKLLPSIIKYLIKYDSSQQNSDAKALRNGLLLSCLDFQFIFSLHLLDKILTEVNSLSKYLQSQSLDLGTARSATYSVIKRFEDMQNCQTFQVLFDQCIEKSKAIKTMLSDMNCDITFRDASLPRRVTPSIRLRDSDLSSTTPSYSSAKELYFNEIYSAAIDKIVLEMNYRFRSNTQDKLVALQHTVSLTTEDERGIEIVSEMYDLDEDLVRAERKTIMNMEFPDEEKPSDYSETLVWLHKHDILNFFPNYGKLVRIFSTIPVTTSSAERSFSSLRQIITYLRSTMTEERLSNCAIIHCNRDISNEVLENDLEIIIDSFAKRCGREKYLIV